MENAIASQEKLFDYDHQQVSSLFGKLLRKHMHAETWTWLEEKANTRDLKIFNTTFAAIPRKSGKHLLQTDDETDQFLKTLVPGFSLHGWTVDRLARVWLMMQIAHDDKEKYFRNIENLFLTGEMNELVALYSSLPFLAYPEMWIKRCAEGIRSNIAGVLQAIMYENPYPSKYLPEPAWNQLVLKAFFTEKSINRITGIDERANTELAHILSDYAHERWAAGRTVNPLLWRCVAPHIDQRIFPDIEKLMGSASLVEKEAAALACSQTGFPAAKSLLKNNPALDTRVNEGSVSWESIAAKSSVD
jgi:hypothetical protein